MLIDVILKIFRIQFKNLSTLVVCFHYLHCRRLRLRGVFRTVSPWQHDFRSCSCPRDVHHSRQFVTHQIDTMYNIYIYIIVRRFVTDHTLIWHKKSVKLFRRSTWRKPSPAWVEGGECDLEDGRLLVMKGMCFFHVFLFLVPVWFWGSVNLELLFWIILPWNEI